MRARTSHKKEMATAKKVNSKNRKILLILVAGILAAIVLCLALYMYLMPQKTTVYVFNDAYEAGETVTEDMLTAVQCDSSIVVAGKSSDTSDVFVTGSTIKSVLSTGDSLRMDVSSGMPLTISMLSVNGGSSIEQSMDPAKVAVTVSITDISGVTSDLKEGSRVNIYYTGDDTAGTTLIFQGMRVLSVNKTSDGELESATLECTTNESLELVYAQTHGSLYFGLIDSSGYEYVDGEPSYAPSSSAE